MRRAIGITCAAALCCSSLGPAQERPDSNPGPLFKSDSAFVWVPTVVETTDGRPLRRPDSRWIRLWDNGLRQQLVQVKTDDLPVSLVVLMQTGGSAGKHLASYGDLPSLLPGLIGNAVHEITLITFDSHIDEIWHFPSQSDGVNYALTHQNAGDRGAAIKDALAFAVRQLQAEPGRFRRMVLLLGEDRDVGSTTSSVSLLKLIGSSSTVVYSLSFRSRNPTRKRTSAHGHAIRTDSIPGSIVNSLDADTAEETALLTGGCRLRFTDQRSFNSGLLAIAEHVRDEYTFGFQPVPQAPGLHILKVEAAKPGLTVTARKAYWFGAGN